MVRATVKAVVSEVNTLINKLNIYLCKFKKIGFLIFISPYNNITFHFPL